MTPAQRQKILDAGGWPKRKIRHGTANEYSNYGCRCDKCKAAWAKTHREWMHASPARQEAHRNRERARRKNLRRAN